MLRFYVATEYQASCHQKFVYYQRQLLAIIPKAQIEHIGSSAIPHAVSKGDLDIYVAVDAVDFDSAIVSISSLGFVEKLDTLRTHELCMLESLQQDDVAIQLVVKNSQWQSFLIFRDRLLKNQNLVMAYNQLKHDSQHLSMDKYRCKKAKFIESVLNQT